MKSFKNIQSRFMIPFLSVIAIGLFSQFYHLYLYRDWNTLYSRLLIAVTSSIAAGLLYSFVIRKIFKTLNRRDAFYDDLYNRFSLCHLPFLILFFYPLQFLLSSDFISRFILAAVLFIVIVLLIYKFLFPIFRHLLPEGMNSWRDIRILLKPLRMVLFLVFYFSIWHILVTWIFLDMKNFEKDLVRGPLSALLSIYFAISLFITFIIYAASYVNKRGVNLALYIILSITVFISLWTRGLDFGTFFYSGVRVDSVIWDHFFNKENLMFMLTPIAFAGIGIVGLIIYIFIILFRGSLYYFWSLEKYVTQNRGISYLAWLSAGITLTAGAVLYFIFFTLFFLTEPLYPKLYDAASYLKIPETHVLTSMYDYYLSSDDDIISRLPDDISGKCVEAGWSINSVSEDYPLFKKSIYHDKKNLNAARPLLKPGTNVIIVFAESFSKYFTDEKMHGQKGLTPNIDDMKRHGVTFENMFNIIAPTITGIIATMGSFPYYVEKYNITQNNHLSNIRFSFLTSILKKYGYYNIHYQGSSADFASAETILKAHGYDDFISIENSDLRNFAVEPKSNWGLRDSDLFRYIVHSLKENRLKEPFLMTVSTIDLHPPYKVNGGYGRFSDPVFDCVYSTDQAFGIFWEYFKSSPYYGNTAVLFIADHAMVMNTKYFKLRGESFNRARQDLITSVLYVPDNRGWENRKIYTNCTNLDIAPTFCDMMGIDSANSFLGLPVFSERPQYPYMPGEVMIDGVFNSEASQGRKISFTPEEHVNIYSYIKGLSVKNRVYPRADDPLLKK